MPANGGQAAEMKMLEDDKRKLKEINTFTRWVNQHLKQAADSPQIENLEADLSDGIMLIKLTEVLAGRKLPRYNKRPTMRTQKLDNISLVLNFLQKEEGIKIVTIDSSHIADRNLKLILGLIWTLILHYSLSHRLFASTADQQQNGGGTVATTAEKREKTPKQLLLSWIQAKLPDRHVSNFTSNWNDGILLGALVDACVDGRFGKWRKWISGNALENTRKAMQAAEKALGVETLITAEELTSPEVDEKSVMTYLAQFARSQPKLLERIAGLDQSSDEEETAETKGMNGAREDQEEEEIEPDSDTAATSQLDHVLKINDDIPPSDSSALFTTSGSEDKTNSNDIEEQQKKFKQYNKSMEEVNASDDGNNGFLEEDDNNSLINETITSASTALQDQEEKEKEQRAHLAWADGPGLAVGVVGQLNPFVVHNANQLGAGELTLNIDGPGNAVVSTNQHPHEDTCHVEYTVQLPGLYTVSVLFNGAHIQGSPFKVFVKPPSSESLSKASTPTTPVGNEQQQQQEPFDYLRMSTNYRPVQIVFEDSPPAANVQNGGGHHNKRLEHVVSRYPEIEDMDDGSKLNGDAALVQVSGEGLDHFVPGQPANFVVDTSATGINTLFVGVVTARGPTQELNIRHIGNGNYVIAYTVPFNSDAHVFIKYGEEHVRGSPFTVCPRKNTHQHRQQQQK